MGSKFDEALAYVYPDSLDCIPLYITLIGPANLVSENLSN